MRRNKIRCGEAKPRNSARKASIKKYVTQYGADRCITPAAVAWLEERLTGFSKLNTAKRRGIFYAAQRLSHCDPKRGATLAQRQFSSPSVGRFIQEGLESEGLAQCLDKDSWKPTGRDLRNSKGRAYLPSWEFLWADIGGEVVATFWDYITQQVTLRPPLHTASDLLIQDPTCGVPIPDALGYLRYGTGLRCDYCDLRRLVIQLPEEKRASKLSAVLGAVGRMPEDEIRPIWRQHEWGRLYSSAPALVNMPKVLLPALRDISGKPLWNVDFSSFELRIACLLTKQRLPDEDAYELLSTYSGVQREDVKGIVTAMLHGQTLGQCWHAGARRGKARIAVEAAIRHLLPNLMAGMRVIQRDESLLQRTGAKLFLSGMAAATTECRITFGGLPKHDGWVFSATDQDASLVRDAFQRGAEWNTSCTFPTKLDRVA